MDIPIEINNFCFNCSVKMNNTQAVWCMIERQQQSKEDHVFPCYCKQAIVLHAYNRPVAGGRISKCHNQEKLLETVLDS
jgi:hypothetical protein